MMLRLRARPALPMPAAMVRALDPYHRIRATVAAGFLLAVLVLALMAAVWPRHPVSSTSSAASVAAPAAPTGPAAHHARRAH